MVLPTSAASGLPPRPPVPSSSTQFTYKPARNHPTHRGSSRYGKQDRQKRDSSSRQDSNTALAPSAHRPGQNSHRPGTGAGPSSRRPPPPPLRQTTARPTSAPFSSGHLAPPPPPPPPYPVSAVPPAVRTSQSPSLDGNVTFPTTPVRSSAPAWPGQSSSTGPSPLSLAAVSRLSKAGTPKRSREDLEAVARRINEAVPNSPAVYSVPAAPGSAFQHPNGRSIAVTSASSPFSADFYDMQYMSFLVPDYDKEYDGIATFQTPAECQSICQSRRSRRQRESQPLSLSADQAAWPGPADLDKLPRPVTTALSRPAQKRVSGSAEVQPDRPRRQDSTSNRPSSGRATTRLDGGAGRHRDRAPESEAVAGQGRRERPESRTNLVGQPRSTAATARHARPFSRSRSRSRSPPAQGSRRLNRTFSRSPSRSSPSPPPADVRHSRAPKEMSPLRVPSSLPPKPPAPAGRGKGPAPASAAASRSRSRGSANQPASNPRSGAVPPLLSPTLPARGSGPGPGLPPILSPTLPLAGTDAEPRPPASPKTFRLPPLLSPTLPSNLDREILQQRNGRGSNRPPEVVDLSRGSLSPPRASVEKAKDKRANRLMVALKFSPAGYEAVKKLNSSSDRPADSKKTSSAAIAGSSKEVSRKRVATTAEELSRQPKKARPSTAAAAEKDKVKPTEPDSRQPKKDRPARPEHEHWRALAKYYLAAGRELKHDAADIFRKQNTKVKAGDVREEHDGYDMSRGLVLYLESIMAFMLSYVLDDYYRALEGRPNQPEKHWPTLLPLWREILGYLEQFSGYKASVLPLNKRTDLLKLDDLFDRADDESDDNDGAGSDSDDDLTPKYSHLLALHYFLGAAICGQIGQIISSRGPAEPPLDPAFLQTAVADVANGTRWHSLADRLLPTATLRVRYRSTWAGRCTAEPRPHGLADWSAADGLEQVTDGLATKVRIRNGAQAPPSSVPQSLPPLITAETSADDVRANIPRLLRGRYWCPMDGGRSPLEVVRFGVEVLREWRKRYGIVGRGRLGW